MASGARMLNSRHEKQHVMPPPSSRTVGGGAAASVRSKNRLPGAPLPPILVLSLAITTTMLGVLNGYNGTIMAYGQTGTDKTYTLGKLGKDDASERGIMVRALEDIIASASLASDSVEISYLQFAAHLLASAGLDSSIYIWNIWSSGQKKARVLNIHTAAVKDVKWSEQGLSLVSCGYDFSSRLIDVEKGLEIREFKEDQVVGVVKFHSNNPNLFLCGGSKGVIRLWDIRSGKAVHEYLRGLGPILDLEFTNDKRQFISSNDESKSNVSENSIIVWDVSRQLPLSNQTRLEGVSMNRGGQFAVVLEVYEVAPSLYMVDVRKAAGDTLEYHKFYKDFCTKLDHIIWKPKEGLPKSSMYRTMTC